MDTVQTLSDLGVPDDDIAEMVSLTEDYIAAIAQLLRGLEDIYPGWHELNDMAST